MVYTLEGYIQQAINSNNWHETITRIENAILQHTYVKPELLERVPSEYIETSPLLQKAICVEHIHRGDLVAAREGLSLVVKKVAAQTLRKPLLSSLALLAVVNVRMGLIHEAEPIIRFLRDEWRTSDEEISGDVAYALARGLYLLKGESSHSDQYYRYAISAYDRDGEVQQASLSLFELAVLRHEELSSSGWEELMTEFAQRVKRRQAGEQLQHCLEALRQLADGKLEQAEKTIKDCRELELAYPYRPLAYILQLKIAIRLKKIRDATQIITYLESLHPESSVDLEWQFEWANVQLEWAVSRSDWSAAQLFISQARAIFLMGLAPRFGEWLARMDNLLNNAMNVVVQDQAQQAETGGQWRANLFGVFKFTLEGQPIHSIHWKRKKTKELALYLLLQQGYFATREQIAEALFPDQEPEKMANQLYVVAHQLKRVISDYLGVDGGVVIKEGMVRLKDGLIREVDVEQYQALVRVGDQLWLQDQELANQMYEQAAGLYDEISIDVQYIDWLELYRERLHMKQCELLRRLGTYAVDQKRYDRAEAYYRQWIDLSPLTEGAYQELMRVFRAQGKLAEAEFLYKQLEQQLQTELGVHPLSETRGIIWR